MIGQSLSNTNEMWCSVQIVKICNLNKAQVLPWSGSLQLITLQVVGTWCIIAPVHVKRRDICAILNALFSTFVLYQPSNAVTESYLNNTGHVRFSYNPSFSACFFSRNSVFSYNKSAGTVFQLVIIFVHTVAHMLNQIVWLQGNKVLILLSSYPVPKLRRCPYFSKCSMSYV